MTYSNKPWPETTDYKRHNTPRLYHSQCFSHRAASHIKCQKAVIVYSINLRVGSVARSQVMKLTGSSFLSLLLWKCSDVDAPHARSPHHYRGQCLAEQECAAATLENRQRGERRWVPRQSLVLRGVSWWPWLSALSPRGYSNPNTLSADRHVRQRNLSRAVVWDAVDNVTDVVEEIESRPAQCILRCSHLSLWCSTQNINEKLNPGGHVHSCFSTENMKLPSKSGSHWGIVFLLFFPFLNYKKISCLLDSCV